MKLRFLVAVLLIPVAVWANISSQVNRTGPFTIAGSPQIIPVGMPFQQGSDLLVIDVGPTGASTPVTLTLGSDYTVTGGGYNSSTQMLTGSISVVAGGAHNVQTNDQIIILRNVPVNQTTSLTPTGPLTSQLIEKALDKQATLSQQLTEKSTRALHFPAGEVLDGELVLAARKSKLLGFDGGGAIYYYDTPTIGPVTGTITQTPTGQWYENQGASIDRLNDRVLIGAATVNDANTPATNLDWMSAFQAAASVPGGGSINYAQAASLTSGGANSSFAFIGGAQSLTLTNAGSSTIGVYGFALNNNTTLATSAWGLYSEAHRTNAAVNAIYGAELDTRTLFSSITPTPYTQGEVIGLQIGSGAGLSATGQFDSSAAIQIVDNPMQFRAGIVFGATAIDGTDGVTGTGVAAALARGHVFQWYNSAGAQTSAVVGAVSTANLATKLSFEDTGAIVKDSQNNAILYVAPSATAIANYHYLAGGISGSGAVTHAVDGADTNINFVLTPKGTGNVTTVKGFRSSSPSAGIGYSTGAGAVVTQLTDKSTTVIVNAISGAITTNNATLNASTSVGFTVTNSSVAATDVVVLSIKSGATADSYTVTVDAVGAGSFHIHLRNTSGGNLSEAIVINFAVIKAVAS